ncbi:transposase [Streptomyces aureus]|uniref:transposase n=1 Tax=Streptomyces aureus TaxID=193461 RepID=UPI0020B107E2
MLEPLLPKGARAGRPPVWPRRRLIDGIRFRVRTGVPWRDVPVEYGPWGRIYDLFRRWQRNGTWHRILSRLRALAEAKGPVDPQARERLHPHRLSRNTPPIQGKCPEVSLLQHPLVT